MSPKRKIPSRKLPSRKFGTASSSAKPRMRPTLGAKPKPASALGAQSQAGGASKPKSKVPHKNSSKAQLRSQSHRQPAAPVPSVPACFWEMGFEELPTLDELRQRYRELSLVLHPDAGGDKQAFLSLRTNYETALSLLNP